MALRAGDKGDLSRLASAPTGLLIASAVFAASLAADILHYYVGAAVFRHLARRYEEQGEVRDNQVEVPLWAPMVPATFYNLKVVLLFAGYVVLLVVFVRAI